MECDIERVLWSQDQISRRVSDIASEISADFHALSSPPVFLGVATGAFLFLADLVRHLSFPLTVDFVRAQSYGSGTESNGAPSISLDLKIDIKGKHVIVVFIPFSLSLTLCFSLSQWIKELFKNIKPLIQHSKS